MVRLLLSTSRTKPRSRKSIERIAMAVLLLFAWGWIAVTFGMLFYHGYYQKPAFVRRRPFLPTPHLFPQSSSLEQQGLDTPQPLHPHESPLLIFTCNRDNYLRETLDDILKYIPNDCSIGCPIVVSQDGNNPLVVEVVQEYQSKFHQKSIPLVHIQHPSALRGGRNAYQALAVHYGWALEQLFGGHATDDSHTLPQRVIILEEDLHVAPDFFSYFAATALILDNDPTLFAVSAFNDNGYKGYVKDSTRILRSDFFPGLGWMMTRKLWTEELATKWPNGYWDDWLRDPDQRRNRQVLRPEISRTYHFGVKGGASQNQFGGLLSKIQLNDEVVDWSAKDLSYLRSDRYNRDYLEFVRATIRAESVSDALEIVKSCDVRVDYTSFEQFRKFARQLQLMDDEKAGIPRTAYKGVVETRPYGEYILMLSPPLRDLENDLQ